jgi:hypothetical protein
MASPNCTLKAGDRNGSYSYRVYIALLFLNLVLRGCSVTQMHIQTVP